MRLNRFSCLDCRQDTCDSGEYYALHDDLWRQINPQGRGMLCIDCAERRLGRELRPSDFDELAPVNVIQSFDSPKLAVRVFGSEWNFLKFKQTVSRERHTSTRPRRRAPIGYQLQLFDVRAA